MRPGSRPTRSKRLATEIRAKRGKWASGNAPGDLGGEGGRRARDTGRRRLGEDSGDVDAGGVAERPQHGFDDARVGRGVAGETGAGAGIDDDDFVDGDVELTEDGLQDLFEVLDHVDLARVRAHRLPRGDGGLQDFDERLAVLEGGR